MLRLDLKLDGDGAWPDLVAGGLKFYHVTDGFALAVFAEGMVSGKPSIAIRIDVTPPGEEPFSVVVESSLQLLLTAADAIRARYGDPRFDSQADGHRDPDDGPDQGNPGA